MVAPELMVGWRGVDKAPYKKLLKQQCFLERNRLIVKLYENIG